MDPLQHVAAAVTPAVMVSACGLVALGLDNQISRMASRLRELVREHRSSDATPERRAALAAQVAVLDRRHALYYRALILNYGALFCFVLTSALWLAAEPLRIPAELPEAVFGVGVVMLAAMAVIVIASIHHARATIQAEAAEVLGGAEAHPPLPPGGPARAGVRA
jgi:hypothetical protein